MVVPRGPIQAKGLLAGELLVAALGLRSIVLTFLDLSAAIRDPNPVVSSAAGLPA